ncbi:hypothetical protein [Streptomyces roseolilacinus]|uniref:hypothetical protein n=1 Tax=Streptomyces roseolilacinus TaxID=66904 RepID=UPI00382476DD
MTELPIDTYIDLGHLHLTTSYLLPSGSLMATRIHGVDFGVSRPLWASVGDTGPEHMDASRLYGLQGDGRLVLGPRVTGPPVLAAVREIVRDLMAAAPRQEQTRQPPTASSPSSSVSVEEAREIEETEEKTPGRSRWDDPEEDDPAPPPQRPVRREPAAQPPRQQVPQGPTAHEVAALMAPGARFTTPHGHRCFFSERGDSAVRHFREYLSSRKEQAAVHFSNVQRYTPLRYWETLLHMCDAAIGLYADRAVPYGQNCVVTDGQGRPWTIGMTRHGGEYRLTHAHFENYQNS